MTTEYSTKDLGEAGALIVKKQKLIKIDRKGNICWFLFENRVSCMQISKQFFFEDLMVNAREYFDTIRRLKSLIFS